MALLIFGLTSILQTAAPAQNWWLPDCPYRVTVQITTGENPLIDKLIEVPSDLREKVAGTAKEATTAQTYFTRVFEVDSEHRIVCELQHQQDPGFLLWILSAETPAHSTRYFDVYFSDHELAETSPTQFLPLVQMSDAAGRWVFDSPAGHYVFEQDGGAFEVFSPVPCDDNEDGKDWMRDDFSRWNGIPNVGDPDTKAIFHPNEDKEADDGLDGRVVSEIVFAGPLRYRLRCTNRFGDLPGDCRANTEYEMIYDILPNVVRATVVRGNDYGYACIMEITPGGDRLEDDDYVVCSDGLRSQRDEKWSADISPEWLYVGDADGVHKLFFAHEGDDEVLDGLNWYDKMQAVMVGWGRGANPGIHVYPNTFYFGFTTSTEHEEIAKQIRTLVGSYEVKIGEIEVRSH